MLSPIVPYSLLKMHWNPEHAQPLSQWPEQHLDVSSTTSSPADKSESYSGRNRSSYSWANDDISALTASNLLKRYAEKYSGGLDSAYERAHAVGTYPDPGAFGGLSGQKTELEPWPLTDSTDASYSLVPRGGHENLSTSKGVATSAGPAGISSVSVVNSNLSDSGYSGSSSCSGSNDYPSSYNSSYLSSGYCPQPGAALPPASLHTLQSTHTLVPSYSPTTPVYSYPPSTYPAQNSIAPSYSHTTATFLPSGLPAPTPVPPRPSVLGGSYSYQSTNIGTSESGGALKRKAFDMAVEENEVGDNACYRKFSYDPLKPGGNSPYSVSDKAECCGNSFSSSASSTDPQNFKPNKPSSQPLVSPQYGPAGEYSPPAGMTGDNTVAKQAFTQQQKHQQQQRSKAQKRSSLCGVTVDTLESLDPCVLDLINKEILDCSPALSWGELAGLTHVKAALEEDLLWPVLRPSQVIQPPRRILLFGPHGGGKTTLTHSLASQIGASLYRLSGTLLTLKGKAEAEQILGSVLQVAGARQPSVVLLSQVETMEEEGLRETLRNFLEKAQLSTGLVIVVCATSRPDLLQDALHRSFAKRYHVGLPDVGMRRQVLLQALSPHGYSLSERELIVVLQRTEGYSVWELLQLVQQALSSASAPAGAIHGKPPAFTDFENAFCKVCPHSTTKEPDTSIEWGKLYNH
ncbi:fidgetin-like protein 2 isoform X1 [Phyllopteryx taeniolatus]|uniref:fidgetin-like protein 2 isoform X1 n=2 Tax=Phyllopteryx taeniolatus TaxID=161469 RepID=UPI002AD3DDDF|nr:fidgetin-like protein 2 isoform X1 [Phyllopteryx taeniolatus]